MKPNFFKIRKHPPTQIKHQSNQDIQQGSNNIQDKFNKLITVFQSIANDLSCIKLSQIKKTPEQNTKSTRNELQIRDRHIMIDLPKVEGNKLRKQQIEIWITDVSVNAFSSAFNYYLSEQLTFEQTKIFCSQSIINNILRLVQQYKIGHKQFSIINKHLSQGVLQFLQKKYPLTLNNDVNKALQKQLHQANNLDLLQHDILYQNKIVFKYRDDGIYNDTIMKVINKIMEIIDAKSTYSKHSSDTKTNYQDFQNYMSNIFQSVFQQQAVNISFTDLDQKNKDTKINQNKQKYQEKVKKYTNYLIGRKISENTPTFTQQDIQTKNLKISSPAILRILTKWCEQLWQKFQTQNYYTLRSEPVLLQNFVINPFFKWMKSSIDNRLKLQKINILKFKQRLNEHCFNQQSNLTKKYLFQNDSNFIPKLEKAGGKFSSHIVNNLHSYIILYLNRLIHGLLKVSHQFFKKQVEKNYWDDWKSPPNFVTFKIGDLVRCKCSSRQKQIVKIYKYIQKISISNPQKLKIIRIKNRLRDGTNDILINVKFNSLIVCEIQLQASNKGKSKFIQCSNSISHYIYQLQRSIFGPITQLCNVWNNFQARAQIYRKMINKTQFKLKNFKTIQEQPVKQQVTQICTVKHDYEPFQLPFSCSFCHKSYFHNSYIFSNLRCKICKFHKCCRCYIKQTDEQQLRNVLFKDKKYSKFIQSYQKYDQKQKLINNVKGICVKIQANDIILQPFNIITVDQKKWLLGKKDGNIYEIQKINNDKQMKQFINNYSIFIQKQNQNTSLINIKERQGMIFATKQFLKSTYKQDKDALMLTQLRFTQAQMRDLMKQAGGSDKDRKKIKRIQFASNYLQTFDFFSNYQNVTSLNISYNNIKTIQKIKFFKKLQKLQISQNNHLQQIDDHIKQLSKLNQLKASNCAITKISPQIGLLKQINKLILFKNSIEIIPNSIGQLKNLTLLDMSINKIKQIPIQIAYLTNLKYLNLFSNAITKLPNQLQALQNLVEFDLSKNGLQNCMIETIKWSKLQTLNISKNKIKQLKLDFRNLINIKNIFLQSNQLQIFQFDFSNCIYLQNIYLQHNKLKQLSKQQFINNQNLINLKLNNNLFEQFPQVLLLPKISPKIDLSNNQIKIIPSSIIKKDNIIELALMNNQLQIIPKQIVNLNQLLVFNVTKNKIKQIPQQLSQLPNTLFNFFQLINFGR